MAAGQRTFRVWRKRVSLAPNDAKFLTGVTRVSKLEFYCNSMLSTEVDVLARLSFLFENLRSLVLAVNFCEMSHILSIFCLLRSAPNLEELDVWGCSSGSQEIEANEDFLNAQWTNDKFAKLLVVRMKKIVCLCNEMHFVEFVLSKARVLRILSVTLASDCLCRNGEAVIELTEYSRVSPEAQVFFMGTESTSSCSINTPTVLPETQTQITGSGLIDDTCSRRQQWELREAQREREDAQREREEAQQYREEAQRYMDVTRQHREYMMSTIKVLNEQSNLNLPLPPPL